MRIFGAAAAVGALALAAALGTTATAQADRGSGGGGDGGGDGQTIRIEDDCDPATFNEAVGAGTCVGDGDTLFGDFIEEVTAEREAGKWRNHPDDTHVDMGETVRLSNTGGEFHTFTRVDAFGGGCAPPLNAILGLAPRSDVFCGVAFATTGVPAGGSATVAPSDLHVGDNLFQCMIHPWMQTTLEVRADHHH